MVDVSHKILAEHAITTTADTSRLIVSRLNIMDIKLPKNIVPMPMITKLLRKLKSALEKIATQVNSKNIADVMLKAINAELKLEV